MTLRILQPGPLAVIEDLGRPGFADIGVSPSGALDRAALRLGNRLLGTGEGCAGVEILLGGFTARFEAETWFAVTGASGPLELDGVPIDPYLAVHAPAGSTLSIGRPTAGMRSYLTVRGGIDVPPVLGSRSSDLLSAVGPVPLASGDVLPVGEYPGTEIPLLDFLPIDPPSNETADVRAHPGPRAEWFTTAAIDALYEAVWEVSAESNRVGMRLGPVREPAHLAGSEGRSSPILERAVTAELPSEPMVSGAVQVSPDGRPTVLLADHPVTGGYPVIAIVAAGSLDRFAQLRPGQRLRFRHAS